MVIINYGVWERPGENIHLLLAQDFMCVRKHVLCPTFFFLIANRCGPAWCQTTARNKRVHTAVLHQHKTNFSVLSADMDAK